MNSDFSLQSSAFIIPGMVRLKAEDQCERATQWPVNFAGRGR
jgi:hypothetical protein